MGLDYIDNPEMEFLDISLTVDLRLLFHVIQSLFTVSLSSMADLTKKTTVLF